MKDGIVRKDAGLQPGEMEEINSYTRREYTPEEVYAFTLTLCDNEIDRDYERFSIDSLKELQRLFLGKTCIFDHERKSANQTARIYRTWLEEIPQKTTKAGEKYTRLAGRAYLPRTESTAPVIELIESGILKEVSVSCSVARSVCGICGKESCAHEKGKLYGGVPGHRVLTDPTDAYECSFVAVPAQRAAGVTKSFGEEDTPVEVIKLLEKAEEGLTLTKAQAARLKEELSSLEEKAKWGEEYRDSLQQQIVRYSALLLPELPTGVVKAGLKGLSLSELSQMGKSYESMAQKALPLKPQLAPEEKPAAESGNREFRI